MKKTICSTLFLSFFVFLMSTTSASALGQVTEPIVVEKALKGEKFEKIMSIINTEETNVKVDIFAEGDITEWVKFYRFDDLENAINDIELSNNERLKLVVKFDVPLNAANNEYIGALSIIRKANDKQIENESSTSIVQKISRNVSITVSDEEILDLRATVIPTTYNVIKGSPLEIRVIYDNQSNVTISPQIQIKIKKDGQTVHNTIQPYPETELAIKPYSVFEIPTFKISTNEYEKGPYIAELTFLHVGRPILSKDFSFSLSTRSWLSLSSLIDQTTSPQSLIVMLAVFIIIIGSVLVKKYLYKKEKINKQTYEQNIQQ